MRYDYQSEWWLACWWLPDTGKWLALPKVKRSKWGA